MLLRRNKGFDTIKPMLTLGKIQKFSDIFSYVQISTVARGLGKRTKRFEELVADVDDFYVRELMMIARLFNFTSEEILGLVIKQLGDVGVPPEEARFPAVAKHVKDGSIQVITDIPTYIELSRLAGLLKKNTSKLKELIDNVEDFQVKKLREMASYCGLSVPQIFSLVANQIEKKSTHGKNKVRM